MKSRAAQIAAVRQWLTDLRLTAMVTGGAASSTYGAWLVYKPAGFVVGGVLLISAAILEARGR